jgi:hypothetical protein
MLHWDKNGGLVADILKKWIAFASYVPSYNI